MPIVHTAYCSHASPQSPSYPTGQRFGGCTDYPPPRPCWDTFLDAWCCRTGPWSADPSPIRAKLVWEATVALFCLWAGECRQTSQRWPKLCACTRPCRHAGGMRTRVTDAESGTGISSSRLIVPEQQWTGGRGALGRGHCGQHRALVNRYSHWPPCKGLTVPNANRLNTHHTL